MRATLFYAYLSGEHPTLPLAELRAILDVEAGHYGITLTLEQLALFEASTLDPAVIVERAGMVKEAGRVAAICEADPRILNECLADVEWGFLVRGGFAVRTRYIQGYAREALPPDVAVRMVASSVAGATGFPVSLDNPVATVRVLVSEGVVVVGVAAASRSRGSMHRRRPRSRPFFRPGALSPHLSRVFVNLSRIHRGGLFLDPFCGTGGFALEASLIGAYAVCGDIDRVMAWGSRINLSWLGLSSRSSVYVGDACRLPLRPSSIDSIATDPPYGRSTSTQRRDLRSIIGGFLYSAAETVKRGGHVVFAAPLQAGLKLEETVAEAGLRSVEKHYMRVHRSLTRILAVAVRP